MFCVSYPDPSTAIVAKYDNKTDSGIDIPLQEDVSIPNDGYTHMIKLGCKVQHFQDDAHQVPHAFDMRARSSISVPEGHPKRQPRTLILANSIGLIDAGYTDELMASVINIGRETVHLKRGERIVQVAACDGRNNLQLEIMSESDPKNPLNTTTSRGGGFGSTGA